MQNPHNRRSNERARTAPGPTRIGYRHADRLISYPHTHSLSISQQPIRIRGRFRRSGLQACTERTGRGAGGRRRDRRTRPRCRWAAAGPGRGARGQRRGQAAVPVNGGGAWPDNEATHRAKLAALTASGRAAAHRHTQRPGPTTRPSRRPEHQRHQSTQQQARVKGQKVCPESRIFTD